MNKVNRIVSGGLLALFLTLIFQALTFFGVISTGAGHLTVALAWLVGTFLITTEVIPGKRATHKALWILLLGIILAGIDVWAVHVKNGLDAQAKSEPPKGQATQQAPPSSAPQPTTDEGPSVQPIPPAKVPRRASGGGVVTNPSNTEKPPVSQSCPDNNGICIGGDNNGQANIYQDAPERRLTASQVEALANAAALIPASQKISVESCNMPECERFADAIYAALKRKSPPSLASGPIIALVGWGGGNPPRGTVVCLHSVDSATKPYAQPIANTLNEDKSVPTNFTSCKGLAENEIKIIIAAP
jgi:hypothetical protein